MPKDILVIWTKNRLKTDQAIENAKKVEKHLEDEYSVLILDKNVESIEWFEKPKDDLFVGNELEKEIEKLNEEKEE